MRSFRRFRNNRDGATAVEFGLIALPFFILVLAAVQIGIIFLAQQVLESAVETVSRTLLVGSVQQANLNQAQFRSSVCAQLPGTLFDCNSLLIDLKAATSFASADTSQPTIYDANGNLITNWSYQPGAAGTVMVMRVMYPLPKAITPLGLGEFYTNGSIVLLATSVFQVEPFGS